LDGVYQKKWGHAIKKKPPAGGGRTHGYSREKGKKGGRRKVQFLSSMGKGDRIGIRVAPPNLVMREKKEEKSGHDNLRLRQGNKELRGRKKHKKKACFERTNALEERLSAGEAELF